LLFIYYSHLSAEKIEHNNILKQLSGLRDVVFRHTDGQQQQQLALQLLQEGNSHENILDHAEQHKELIQNFEERSKDDRRAHALVDSKVQVRQIYM